MDLKSVLPILALVSALCAPSASAKVSEEEAARLGKDLTPLGAEVAGEGDVPAWTGGLIGVPEGIVFDPKTQHPPNPFPDDKVKYTITRENMAAYDALLTDGHKAMLKRVPGFKMNVYQSRRSCTVPAFVQEATKRNATEAELTADGEGVTGGSMGTPFPIPQSAKELMWNHRLRYVPHKMVRYLAMAPVVDGKYELVKYKDRRITFWTAPDHRAIEARDNLQFMETRKYYAPSSLLGMIVLFHETTNSAARASKTWAYVPGIRRVQAWLSPKAEAAVTGGLSSVESLAGFSGAFDRYDWASRGRGVKLVPYNSYDLVHSKYGELMKRNGLNPDSVRYEPHRVWVVEAKSREGKKNLHDRRMLYLDEDTHAIVTGELYDGRGKLWRVQELHTINFYNVPVCLSIADLVYDVQKTSRYLVASLSGEEKPINALADEIKESCFDPHSLRTGSPVNGGFPSDVDGCDPY